MIDLAGMLTRQQYATDPCLCGHLRRWHYRVDGSTTSCLPSCRCTAYAWSGDAAN